MYCPAKEPICGDPFVECHTLRQSLVDAFPSSEWGDRLRRYGESVDCRDRGCVNNFSVATLELIGNQTTDRSEWHTALSEPDAERWLADLGIQPCAREEFTGARIRAMIPNRKEFTGTGTEIRVKIPDRETFTPARVQAQPENVAPNRIPQEKPREFARFPRQPLAAGRPADVETEATENKSLFLTARDELRKQRQQRGVPTATEPPRKCLGPRRHGGFVPPFVKDVAAGDGAQSAKRSRVSEPSTEELEDERLANLDPKMVELIRGEIMSQCSDTITWDDVAGLEYAKASIQEMVVWPLLRPDLFTGLRRPPRGLLLFGPPGTGKTLLGRCIAAHAQATFFCVSASTLTSKWVGDGEKMVRVLFAVARCHQPAVVFIDEIDSILTQRSDTEHESSRRLKTEFLVQLDGAGVSGAERVLVVGATNRPQELDEAARRRLVKRLYIPLPDEPARRQLVSRLLSGEKHCLSDTDMETISALTEGFSGADLRAACAEAALGPVRELGANMRLASPDQVRPLSAMDFKVALTRVKPSVAPGDLDAYLAWDKTFGCGN